MFTTYTSLCLRRQHYSGRRLAASLGEPKPIAAKAQIEPGGMNAQ
jgi:hypothetical protein